MLSLFRLIFWGGLWLIAWIFVTTIRSIWKTPRLDNCLTWSLRRWDEDGGYLVIRWARSARVHWMRWPHFLWLSEEHHQELKHFLPRVDDMDKHFLPAPWFEGHVQKGDPPDEIADN